VNNDRRVEQKAPAGREREFQPENMGVAGPAVHRVHRADHLFIRVDFLGDLPAAPLEQPANPAATPNPSKAPWYFLGLQEMLVYYDPWYAGVVLPTIIIVGLMAIPYIDLNPKGNGYYTFAERKFSISIFLFGYLALWVFMIITGTFLRGPGWNFFGPSILAPTRNRSRSIDVTLVDYVVGEMVPGPKKFHRGRVGMCP